MAISITAPLTREAARQLRAGDSCLISGVIYTARDAAHKRLCELVAQGKELPMDVKNSIIQGTAHGCEEQHHLLCGTHPCPPR